MAKKGHKQDMEVPMDMTPMIDCVFQLIIFLMIITDMSQQDLEDLELPEATHCLPDEDPEANRPIINVTQEGAVILKRVTLYHPKESLNRSVIRRTLSIIASGMKKERDENLGIDLPDGHLLIRGDEFTDWFHLAKVMEDCGDKNIMIWKVQLAVAESIQAKKKREKEQGN